MSAPALPVPSSSWLLYGGRAYEQKPGTQVMAKPGSPLKGRILAALRVQPLRYKELCVMIDARPGSISNALYTLARKRLVARPRIQGAEWALAPQ